MSYLILMPVTYESFGIDCMRTMHNDLLRNMVTIDQTVKNIGAASAYNVGARKVLDKKLDWLITLSPSTRFGPQGGKDFIKYLENDGKDAWVVESDMPVGWHFIAWHRRVFERIGIWDENFWPVYGEDADISYRILTAIEEDKPEHPWHVCPLDAWLIMQGYSARLGGVDTNQVKIWEYYKQKWGGLSGHETYKRPFNAMPLDYWEKKL